MRGNTLTDYDARVVLSILRGEYQDQDLVYLFRPDPEKRLWRVTSRCW
jgi:hypothetical protein